MVSDFVEKQLNFIQNPFIWFDNAKPGVGFA
jgi:hypothetical protein